MAPSADLRSARTVVLATNNRGKLRELRELATGIPVEFALPTDVGATRIEVVEDGVTFLDNATKKARVVAEALGRPVLADDSGLEVDVLQGRPGVLSARFAGEGATDMANNTKLIEELEKLGAFDRADECTARFRCVLVFWDPETDTLLRRGGTVEGSIVRTGRGGHGFGYDPLFVVRDFPGRLTMAELTDEEKCRVSHRARAFSALTPGLLSWASRRPK